MKEMRNIMEIAKLKKDLAKAKANCRRQRLREIEGREVRISSSFWQGVIKDTLRQLKELE